MNQSDRQARIRKLKMLGIFLTFDMLVILAGWAIYAVPAPLVDRMLESDIRHRALQLKKQVVSHLADANATFLRGTMSDHDQEFLELLPATSDIYRFKLFDASGRIFWSTRPAEVGSIVTKPYFTDIIANGNIYYSHEEKPIADVESFNDEHLESAAVFHPPCR